MPADHSCRTITGADELKYNEMNEMSDGMKFVAGENRRSSEKNCPSSHFVLHETHVEWSSRELRTPAEASDYRLLHEAA